MTLPKAELEAPQEHQNLDKLRILKLWQLLALCCRRFKGLPVKTHCTFHGAEAGAG